VQSTADRVGRDRDLERLLTFVDAVAAVAITLLVLPLVDLAGLITSNRDSVWQLISTHSGQFWGFGLSFVVIARLWLVQHGLLRTVVAVNRRLIAWLILWTLSIVFLPFPTALLPNAGSETATKILYIGTLTVSSACITVLAFTIATNRDIRDRDESPEVWNSAATTVLMLVALGISLAFPRASYFPLLLIGTADPASAAFRRLTRHRLTRHRSAGG
jgi:uncharacterized membrane protein